MLYIQYIFTMYKYYGCSTVHGTAYIVPPLVHHSTGLHSYIFENEQVLPLYLLGGFIVKFLFVAGIFSYYYYYIYAWIVSHHTIHICIHYTVYIDIINNIDKSYDTLHLYTLCILCVNNLERFTGRLLPLRILSFYRKVERTNTAKHDICSAYVIALVLLRN